MVIKRDFLQFTFFSTWPSSKLLSTLYWFPWVGSNISDIPTTELLMRANKFRDCESPLGTSPCKKFFRMRIHLKNIIKYGFKMLNLFYLQDYFLLNINGGIIPSLPDSSQMPESTSPTFLRTFYWKIKIIHSIIICHKTLRVLQPVAIFL